jgi:hypothetical protein
MKRYNIRLPFTGYFVVEVNAESEEEAVTKARQNVSFDDDEEPTKDFFFEIGEWDVHDKVVEGNFFHGILSKIEIEEEELEDDDE